METRLPTADNICRAQYLADINFQPHLDTSFRRYLVLYNNYLLESEGVSHDNGRY